MNQCAFCHCCVRSCSIQQTQQCKTSCHCKAPNHGWSRAERTAKFVKLWHVLFLVRRLHHPHRYVDLDEMSVVAIALICLGNSASALVASCQQRSAAALHSAKTSSPVAAHTKRHVYTGRPMESQTRLHVHLYAVLRASSSTCSFQVLTGGYSDTKQNTGKF